MEKRTCLHCGKNFEVRVFWQKYCFTACRIAAWALREVNKEKTKTLKKLVVVFFISFFFSTNVFASTPAYFNRVVDAIYKAEGGPKAKVPYGILSVKVSSKAEARKVCYNTVKNNWGRWEKAGRPGCYLSFLANRYCPVGAENDNGTNKFWQKNVEAFLK